MDYLNSLNEEQKKAVLATAGPVLIVAGAGAGKTKTLTHRILHLIASGVLPENILAITFTNKAAKEMRDRIISLLDGNPSLANFRRIPFISTFHALGVQIIKENSELLKLPRHFSIFDTADTKKVLKDAMVRLGIDPKEHLDKVRYIISKEKGRGVNLGDYSEKGSYDFTSEIIKKVWREYEETLQKEHALDFDDLLLKTLKLLEKYPEVLEKYHDRFLYIHIDEYQDTNKVQNSIVELLAKKNKNICVVGDTDQCLTKGTQIKMADGSLKSIEKVKKGELILSNYGSGDFRGARVMNSRKMKFSGEMIRVETEKGHILESTPDHIHFAGYRLEITPQIYLNYLMYKKDVGWRIGTTSVYTKGQKKSVVGFVQRSNQEHADSLWIIGTYKTQNEARVQEYILSLKYQIPTLPFTARKGMSINGYVHNKDSLKEIFSFFETENSAIRLLADLGLTRSNPHHQPRSKNSKRRNINVTLCADRRGKNPMHVISISGNDKEGRRILESVGLSVRSHKRSEDNWRFESARSNYREACLLAIKIAAAFTEPNLIFTARLGGIKTNSKDGNSLPCTRAGSVMPGMALFSIEGYDVVSKVTRIKNKKINVFDLNIEKTHNFIANNIVTHNCIYSWRGAEIKNVLYFEKTYPSTQTFFLEQNYRSTKNILAVANEIIEKNNFRIPKKLFTENHTGEKISLFEGRNEIDEAHFIALKSKELIESGVAAEDIAVLYRANFQSRVLEDAFLAHGVPYQMIGTKFFERKEIKDMVSFIRTSLNPENISDLMRIINIPTRGIGKTTLQKIITGKEDELPESMRIKINNFRKMLSDFKTVLLSHKPSDSIKYIVKKSGVEDYLNTGLEEDRDRLENIMELVTLATSYDNFSPEEGIEKFLTDTSLASDQDSLDGKKSGVKLMTVHASKGLEFDYVFICGLENDLFPHSKMRETRKSGEDSEEERRLFYVAVTRAGRKLFLTYAQTRTIFGTLEVNSPSEFLDDIPSKYLETESNFKENSRPILSIDF